MQYLLGSLALVAVIFVAALPNVNANAKHHCYLYDSVDINSVRFRDHVREQKCENYRVNLGNDYCYRTEMIDKDGGMRVSGGCVFTKQCFLYGGLYNCKNRMKSSGTTVIQCCCKGNLCNSASSTVISFWFVLFISGQLVNRAYI